MTRYKLICISGVSGAGKSTLEEYLRRAYPSTFVSIPSYTTRPPRKEAELSYQFISKESFSLMQRAGDFAWTREIHGNWYGTKNADIADSFIRKECSIIIITPECLPILGGLCKKIDRSLSRVLFLHLWSPGETLIRRRLRIRNESPQVIEQRIQDCKTWDRYVADVDPELHIQFLMNEGTFEAFFVKASRIIFKEP